MTTIWTYVLLVVGFVLLIKGADFFVEGSSSIAKRLKVPPIIIGLTIVASESGKELCGSQCQSGSAGSSQGSMSFIQ